MKNTIKKSLSLLLACLLVMSISVISVAAETDAVAITIGTVDAVAGEQVVVPVSIGADSGVASGAFAIDYDSAYLTFVEATDGDLDFMIREVGVTADNVNQIGVAFVGADLEALDAAGGVMFNLVFEVAAEAPSKTVDLSFNFDAARETDDPGLFDVDNAAVAYETVNGGVVIAGVGEYAPAAIALTAASGLPGETVAVDLTISANSCVVSGAFTIEYDGAVLDFVDYTDGELAGITQLNIADTADGEAAVGVVFTTEDVNAPITAGGKIATLNFAIGATAEAGESALTFNLVRPDDALTQGGVATAEALDEDATFTGANVTVESAVTTVDVTFVVTPEDATIEFNGETQTAIEGYATFEGVEFGEKAYKISAEGYITAEGTVEVAEDLTEVVVALEEVPAPTATDVTFNVTPADATVTLNGVTVTAVDGVATFKEVEFGTYTYTVAKEGYVSASADVTVALDMAAVTVVLEEVPTEPETAPVPELVGLRTFAQSYDAETQTITVTSLDTNATAGISIVIAGAELSQYTTDSGNGISVSTSGGYKRFVARQTNGLNQNFNIYYTDANGNKFTYLVNFSFIADPSVIGFDDILTLRVDEVTYSASNKKFTLRADNARWKKSASSSGAFLYVADPDVTVTYEYTGDGKMSAANTDKYTAYTTGVNTESAGGGAYGKVGMKIYPWTNGNTMLTKVTLTKGEYSTTYEINLLLRDISYEGNVNVTEVLPLRADADSFVINNDAKTISFETTTAYTSAGFAVAVDRSVPTLAARPRRQLTAASGYNLAHGPVSAEDENKFDRYVVARLSAGTEQTYKVKVTGGEDGLEFSWYTVTVKFNRIYEGDIEFADMLTKNTDSYSFDAETNTINVTYSGSSAAIAPVLIENCRASVSSETAVITTTVDGVKGYAVKAENGANQVVYLTLKVGNDTTVYTVNFNYVG